MGQEQSVPKTPSEGDRDLFQQLYVGTLGGSRGQSLGKGEQRPCAHQALPSSHAGTHFGSLRILAATPVPVVPVLSTASSPLSPALAGAAPSPTSPQQ